MVAKYTGLPDVDYESQEVFENSDVEEIEPVQETGSVDPNIVAHGLDHDEATLRFDHEVVVSDDADFLGNVSLGKYIGYDVRRVDETRHQKLARINLELQQLVLENNENVSESESNAKSSNSEIEKLVVLLEGIQKNQINRDELVNLYGSRIASLFSLVTKDIATKGITPKIDTSSGIHSVVDTALVLELEQRVHKLEAKIGPEFFASQGGSLDVATIHGAIQELARKTHIIHNPEYAMDVVKQKIDTLKKENDILETQTKVLGALKGTSVPGRLSGTAETGNGPISETERLQINELHSRISEFDAVNNRVPHIIERLKTLQRVHIDSASCVNFVGEFDLVVQDMNADMVRWDESINKCMSSLEAYEANFAANKETVLKQIDELARKVQSMTQSK